MVGVADYKRNNNNHPVLIKINVGGSTDYFVNYNRATGINSQNDEADNEVTIVKGNGGAYSQSWLQATLTEGQTHTISNGNVGGGGIKVKYLRKITEGSLWKAEVFIGTNLAVSLILINVFEKNNAYSRIIFCFDTANSNSSSNTATNDKAYCVPYFSRKFEHHACLLIIHLSPTKCIVSLIILQPTASPTTKEPSASPTTITSSPTASLNPTEFPTER